MCARHLQYRTVAFNYLSEYPLLKNLSRLPKKTLDSSLRVSTVVPAHLKLFS